MRRCSRRCAGKHGEQVIEHGVGMRLSFRQVVGHRRIDFAARTPAASACSLCRIPEPGIRQERADPNQRFEGPCMFDFLSGAIAAGIIGGGVIAQSVRQRLDQTRSGAAARGLERLADDLADREHIVAVDLHARNPRGDRLLRQRLRGCLRRHRHRNRPAVVDDDEYHRQARATRPDSAPRRRRLRRCRRRRCRRARSAAPCAP